MLEVTDKGKPPLVAYRRAILNVSGKPVDPPPGTLGVEEDLTKPVTNIEDALAKTGKWSFWRGVNSKRRMHKNAPWKHERDAVQPI